MLLKNQKDIVVSVPSKGSLYEGTLKFLSLAGLPVIYGSQRQYTARLGNINGVSILFQRAEEIPAKVAAGTADLGVTGEDIFKEQYDQSDEIFIVQRNLGYGHARLVLAVPTTWIDIVSMEDLAELAISFRVKHNRTLRIATKFPSLAREFLTSNEIFDYTLVESLGATESTPSSGAADLIIDLTSSGKTLSENSLKEIKNGTVISSQACIIASKRIARWDDTKLANLETFLDVIESYIRSKDISNLEAIIPCSKLTELKKLKHICLLAYSTSTDSLIYDEVKAVAQAQVRITCLRHNLFQVIDKLRENGAEEIIVTKPEYVFHNLSESFQKLKRFLKKISE